MATKKPKSSVFERVAALGAAPAVPQEGTLPGEVGGRAEVAKGVRSPWDLTEDQRAQVLATLAAAVDRSDRNTEAAMRVILAGGPELRGRLAELQAIDRRCAENGYLSEADRLRREAIGEEAAAVAVADPAAVAVAAPAPAPAPAPVPAPAPAPAPVPAPVPAPDWARLWKQVESGELTEADARELGARWLAG